MPTGIVTTQYPNYSGAIFLQGNAETPLLSLISGRSRLSNSYRFICGQGYTLAEATIPNISERQSLTAPPATSVERTQDYNVTQIFQETVGTSYMREASMGALNGVNNAEQMANPASELNFQIAAKVRKMGTDIERTFIQGVYHEAVSDSDANQTRGLVSAVRSNVTDVNNKELSIWDVAELMVLMSENGAITDGLVLWCDSVTMFQLCKEAESLGIRPIDNMVAGIKITTLITPVGTVSLHAGRFLPAGTALLLNINVLAPVEQATPGKGNFFYEELAKTGAGTTGQIFGLLGLDYGPEWYHGKITGIKTVFERPNGLPVSIKGVVPVVDSLPEISSAEIVDTSIGSVSVQVEYTGKPVSSPALRYEYFVGNKPISKFEPVHKLTDDMVGKYVKVRVSGDDVNATGSVMTGSRKLTERRIHISNVNYSGNMQEGNISGTVDVTLDYPVPNGGSAQVYVYNSDDGNLLTQTSVQFDPGNGAANVFLDLNGYGLTNGDTVRIEAVGDYPISGSNQHTFSVTA